MELFEGLVLLVAKSTFIRAETTISQDIQATTLGSMGKTHYARIARLVFFGSIITHMLTMPFRARAKRDNRPSTIEL